MLDAKLNDIIWAQHVVIFDAATWSQLDAIFDTKLDPVIGSQLNAIFDTELDAAFLAAQFGNISPSLCHPYLRLKALRVELLLLFCNYCYAIFDAKLYAIALVLFLSMELFLGFDTPIRLHTKTT